MSDRRGFERELCTLIFRLGLDYGEIAELTGVPLGTVKIRMHAIRGKLREFLGDRQAYCRVRRPTRARVAALKAHGCDFAYEKDRASRI